MQSIVRSNTFVKSLHTIIFFFINVFLALLLVRGHRRPHHLPDLDGRRRGVHRRRGVDGQRWALSTGHLWRKGGSHSGWRIRPLPAQVVCRAYFPYLHECVCGWAAGAGDSEVDLIENSRRDATPHLAHPAKQSPHPIFSRRDP